MNLKTPLLKDKKLTSEKLRIENKKMELRLQQLKLAMSKEKEERLSNGIQSNWTTGSPGALLNYKPILSGLDTSKKIKLKMLKEEAIIAPRSSNVKINVLRDIGSLDMISSKKDSITEKEIGNKINVRSCGQCDDNSAAVNCKECAEDYCPKCFASFHLKGALRKHRSTPISNITNRVSNPYPLFKPLDLKNMSTTIISTRNKSAMNAHEIKLENNYSINETKMDISENPIENDIPKYYESTLAEGNYNEEAANQSFQEAIYAWRNNIEFSEPIHSSQKLPTTEHSTETIIVKIDKKILSDLIQFTSSMTYAEQLLLRKHRNNQLLSDDMKYVLSRLVKTNELDILENQKLLTSDLTMKTSLINNDMENILNDEQHHIDFESVNQLFYDADLMEGRKSLIPVQMTLKSSLKIEELSDPENIQRCSELLMENELLQKESNYSNSNKDQNYKINSYLSDYRISQDDNIINENERPISKSKRSKSSLNRNIFYTRPKSGRKKSARNDKGGKLTSKPSELLNIMANLNSYLPYTENNEDNIKSKVPSKISNNFYKLSLNSWKPTYSLSSEIKTDVHDFHSIKNTSSVGNESVDKDIENELNKLNLLSDETKISNASVILKSNNSSHCFPLGFNDGKITDLNEETKEQETMIALDSLDDELTLISRNESELSFHNNFQHDMFTDSLEISKQNQCFQSLESDIFYFEDSLDFEQRHSNDSYTIPDLKNEDKNDELFTSNSPYEA